MADTQVATGLRVQQWDDKVYREFLNDNILADYMGTGENDLVQVKENLLKKKGDSVTFAMINRLKNAATTGSNVLEGNEEDMATRSMRVYVDKRRNAVRVAEMEQIKSAIDLRNEAKPLLMDWLMELQRTRFLTALGSINGVPYPLATSGQRDAWLADNADRVLFGKAKSNNASNSHSASMANVDSTNDRLTGSAISLMKRMAGQADPKIKPVRVQGDRRYWVALCGSNLFRDLRNDPVVIAAQKDVMLSEENNRLFRGGDILWDNVLVREVYDMPTYVGVGTSGINVGPFYLLGAQALGYAVAKRTRTIAKEFDYEDKEGVAIEIIDGVVKLIFGSGTTDTANLKDHGVLTGYFADIADS